MAHTVKRGDTKTLRWNLGRDLTGVTTARVLISPWPGATPVVDRNGTIDNPASAGIVSLLLQDPDFAAGKLDPQSRPWPYRSQPYLIEIETSPGPLTHPDDAHAYERLYIEADLA